MPANQAALLRGVNVGSAKRIAMSELRDVVASLGFGDVRTLLASGNVVYSAGRVSPSQAATRIERAIVEHFGITSRVVALAADDVARAVDENPLPTHDPSRLMIGVLYDPADAARLAPIAAQDWGEEHVAVGTRVVYFRRLAGVVDSPLTKAIARVVRDGITTRNVATMGKLRDALGV